MCQSSFYGHTERCHGTKYWTKLIAVIFYMSHVKMKCERMFNQKQINKHWSQSRNLRSWGAVYIHYTLCYREIIKLYHCVFVWINLLPCVWCININYLIVEKSKPWSKISYVKHKCSNVNSGKFLICSYFILTAVGSTC